MTEKRNDYTLYIIYINIILLAICYQLQKPIEPYLIEKLNENSHSKEEGRAIHEYAKLQSFFSIIQTIGSLAAGCALDTISPRFGFLISFSASIVGYFLVIYSTTTSLLFISKIPSIFQAGYLCAQTYVAQSYCSDSVERVRILGRLAMCYTVGVIVGPALGGWLSSSGDLYAGARVAVLLSMLAFVLSFCMSSSSPVPTATSIPQYESSIRHKSAINQASLSSGQILSKLTSVLRAVWPLLLVKIFISFANSLSDATRPIVLKNEFFFDHTHLGYFMSFSSCVSAVSDGALTGPLVNILGNELSIVQSSCIAILVCLYITQAVLTSALFGALWISMSYYSSLISYVCTYFVILVFRHILSSTVTGLTTGRVQADEKGTLLGLENALYAAARVIGPLVGVQLYTVGRASLVAFGSAIVFGVCYFFWSRLKSMGKPSVPIKTDIISDEEEEDDVLISQQQTSHLRL